ncbi:hypothetical protein NVP1039O_45 [Vibrio phage 1.039.O._10N.286.55.A2]|nr:hypothetical protein NVP1003O_46 [Vibrio phage 1.003.O._10N.286.48.A2]AUR83744.1 hypothetical protein NVP1039O_45 [Vibrio phage 1.039.O._10N.286.55.A2]AUR83861.1 hypothetical protein NVP1042O_73 [Vibrio phage 1.042.O._10N.286.45.B8]AUR84624.1 hypothetical protein NVP1061O_43 [Vibrio phage 1.061.O._10N.286.55.C2]AUR85066.1 hypothetical protein NVP1067O_54 [Vibrio phage 1.067.O._10N.261.52.C9]
MKTVKVKIFKVWIIKDIKGALRSDWILYSVHGTRSEAKACHKGIVFDWKITQETIHATV